MLIDEAVCHAAAEAKDRRYDGLFFIGVTSTGIYCRCVCTARAPKRQNRTFHPSAAAAEKAGFRPCLLCRPELAPGAAPIDAAERLASAVAKGKLKLARGAIATGRDGLIQIPGIGPWTIEYVALRGLGDPDAFPLGDSALRAAFDGNLKRTNETWRPWRAYAAARLWHRSRKMERQAA